MRRLLLRKSGEGLEEGLHLRFAQIPEYHAQIHLPRLEVAGQQRIGHPAEELTVLVLAGHDSLLSRAVIDSVGLYGMLVYIAVHLQYSPYPTRGSHGRQQIHHLDLAHCRRAGAPQYHQYGGGADSGLLRQAQHHCRQFGN